VACFPASFGDLGSKTTPSASNSGDIEWSTPIGAAAPTRRLELGLYRGYGVFSSGTGNLRTGTFTLTGDELQYATCGLCLTLRELDQGATVARYMATGGTVTLSSISGQLTGTITNATFQHANIATGPSFMSTPHPDGCTTAVGSMTFDVTITGQGGAGGGAGAGGASAGSL
jgi:hypothetical protein